MRSIVIGTVLDIYSFIGAALVGVTLVVYYRVLVHQHRLAVSRPSITTYIILSVRSAVIIPGFALCYWISLAYPNSYAFMQLPEAYLQAYAVFCFFALTTTYAGGPEKCLEIFRTSDRTTPSCLFKCMNSNPARCYSYAYWAHWQFVFIRPVVVVFSIVAYYAGQDNLSNGIGFIATIMVAWAVTGLFKIYHVLQNHCKGMNATKKIFLVKTTIGLVLGQGFLEGILFDFNVITIHGTIRGYSNEERAIRLYCFIVLVELAAIAFIMWKVFAYTFKSEKLIRQQAEARRRMRRVSHYGEPIDAEDVENGDFSSVDKESEPGGVSRGLSTVTLTTASTHTTVSLATVSTGNGSNVKMTFGQFLYQMITVMDVFPLVKLANNTHNNNNNNNMPLRMSSASTLSAASSGASSTTTASSKNLNSKDAEGVRDSTATSTARESSVAMVVLSETRSPSNLRGKSVDG